MYMVFSVPKLKFAAAAVSEPRPLRNGYIKVRFALRSFERDGDFAAYRGYVSARIVKLVGYLRGY